MVLTLANRGVYFFQAGTEELVNEWVSTCNYWAARTSKEPLAGGVSNMEYGWNRIVDVYGDGQSPSQIELPKDEIPDSVSVRSGKSSRSRYGWKDGLVTVRGSHSPRPDPTFINEWKPPLPPTVASTHDEETQLEALRKHVVSLKKDLEVHNELRQPMSALVSTRNRLNFLTLYLIFILVHCAFCECHEGSEQLGREVAVPLTRNCQI
jgi:PH/SEC7 domain-containing protein